jgi:hypothetical protein
MMCSLLVAALTGVTAYACEIQIRVACPNDRAAAGVKVTVAGVGSTTTDSLGIATIDVPDFGTYTVSVDPSTLPAGATLNPLQQKVKVLNNATPVALFELGGDFCSEPCIQGQCWLTGGGTIYKTKGTANYSFGGVVYPGCSPRAADGGNWNVVDHFLGLHFQGKAIIVDDCSGVSTRSPRVNVNIIDFHGTGTLVGIAGNPQAKIDVSFVGRAVDNLESGGGNDLLYLSVTDADNNVVMLIGTSATDPVVISTGNLQIHTSSCN